MVQVLHARAATTVATRKKIQQSKKSISEIAREFNINRKTVMKWRKRDDVLDLPFGSKKLRTVLTEIEQKAICIFRKSTNHSLDDCFIALEKTIPNLSRSNLHRCLKRNGLSVLPSVDPTTISANKKKFKTYEIGYLHIDITEVNLENNPKFYLFVAIDRVSKMVVARLYQNQTAENSIKFLNEVIELFPYKIHRILTDNGAQFTYELLLKHLRPKRFHPFDLLCKKHAIKHKLTKFRHPWTNGQVERMNRTIKDATTKTYHYDSITQFEKHLQEFLLVYNFAKKLKSLNFKTPFEFLTEKFKTNPSIFYQNPVHYSRGLNTCQQKRSSGL
jgi:transposase InsO family protein